MKDWREEMESQIRIETDYIILKSIAKYGYPAMPLNYDFLDRYSLKALYIEIVKNRTLDRVTEHLEKAAKSQAEIFLSSGCDLAIFKKCRKDQGDQTVKKILGNRLYWKVFLNILKTEQK
ncbi:hypothetical protein [Bacteroides sp. 51]|uniref:hypothetical protein n=1 Tax=Bacteroides sp. 51 TaxID=2302938 RepID=UPI0013D53D66|nr:hypothetical protein [Bacteroides sp. 51]NDV83443.1 hypothetical protein [Bacteroides sp. 51]